MIFDSIVCSIDDLKFLVNVSNQHNYKTAAPANLYKNIDGSLVEIALGDKLRDLLVYGLKLAVPEAVLNGPLPVLMSHAITNILIRQT